MIETTKVTDTDEETDEYQPDKQVAETIEERSDQPCEPPQQPLPNVPRATVETVKVPIPITFTGKQAP